MTSSDVGPSPLSRPVENVTLLLVQTGGVCLSGEVCHSDCVVHRFASVLMISENRSSKYSCLGCHLSSRTSGQSCRGSVHRPGGGTRVLNSACVTPKIATAFTHRGWDATRRLPASCEDQHTDVS